MAGVGAFSGKAFSSTVGMLSGMGGGFSFPGKGSGGGSFSGEGAFSVSV